jgi:hypothetical protein
MQPSLVEQPPLPTAWPCNRRHRRSERNAVRPGMQPRSDNLLPMRMQQEKNSTGLSMTMERWQHYRTTTCIQLPTSAEMSITLNHRRHDRSEVARHISRVLHSIKLNEHAPRFFSRNITKGVVRVCTQLWPMDALDSGITEVTVRITGPPHSNADKSTTLSTTDVTNSRSL